MGLSLRFSLSTGPSNLSQSKVCSGRTPQCPKALTCGDKSVSEALPIKESLGKEKVPFSFLGTSYTTPAQRQREGALFQECGCPTVPSGESPQPLCNLCPTANPWQVQWALSPEHTLNASTFPASLLLPPWPTPGPNQSHLLPGLHTHLPAPAMAPPQSRIHTAARVTFKENINQIKSYPLFKIFQRLPADQRTKLKPLTTISYMIRSLPTSASSQGPLSPSSMLSGYTGLLSSPEISQIFASGPVHRMCSLPGRFYVVYACLTFYPSHFSLNVKEVYASYFI